MQVVSGIIHLDTPIALGHIFDEDFREMAMLHIVAF